MLIKTKAALQSCQWQYEILKHAQNTLIDAGGQRIGQLNFELVDLTRLSYLNQGQLILKLNSNLSSVNRAKKYALQQKQRISRASLVHIHLAIQSLDCYFLAPTKKIFYSLKSGQQCIWMRIIFVTKFAVLDISFILSRYKYPVTDHLCITSSSYLDNERRELRFHLVDCLLSGKAILRHYFDTPLVELLLCLRWRRLISPLAAVTKNAAVVSPLSFSFSISSITSWGTLMVVICDFAFFEPVAISETPDIRCMSVYAKKMIRKGLKCMSLYSSFKCIGDIHHEKTKPSSAVTLTGPLTEPLSEVTVMAEIKHTQTRPQFTWLFLATHEHSPESTPITVRFEADTEEDARAAFPGMMLTFAAKIRTESPYHLTWTDEEHATLWSIIGGNIDISARLPVQEVRHV